MVGKAITFFNQKGGVGKTELSVHAAVGLSRRGYKVILVDTDKQGTSMRWAAQADDAAPFPIPVVSLAQHERDLHKQLVHHFNNYDFIVVDCPPSMESGAASSAMLVSKLALIPVIPAFGDLWAMEGAKALASQAQALNPSLLVRTVPNMVQRQTVLAREAIEALESDTAMPPTQARFASRSAYREVLGDGSTVYNQARAREAVAECEALVTEVLDLLVMPQVKKEG